MIRARNWDTYQAFKDREPKWIKLHRRLLRSRKWRTLSPEASKLLIDIWMLVAERGEGPGHIRSGLLDMSPADLAWVLRLDEEATCDHLRELARSGYIQVDGLAVDAQEAAEAPAPRREPPESQAQRAGALVDWLGVEHIDLIAEVRERMPTPATFEMSFRGKYGPDATRPTVERLSQDQRRAVAVRALQDALGDTRGTINFRFLDSIVDRLAREARVGAIRPPDGGGRAIPGSTMRLGAP